VPTKQRRLDRGSEQARLVLADLAKELRIARLSAGLSQDRVGRAVGISGRHVGRLEQGTVPHASIVLFARLFAVLGMRLRARPYPDGSSLRDAAHARLLLRLRRELPEDIRMRTEVPLRQQRGLRAWDAQLTVGSERCMLEAETVLYDLQATGRRIALKMADDGVDRVILLVADTPRNRRVLREFRPLLAERFPLDTRAIMRDLRDGRLPQQGGIVIL
jgi:transcriptional regulator with XRE-family HTH domain